MPSPVIRFCAERAILALVFWAARVRARSLLPTTVLLRDIAVAACDVWPWPTASCHALRRLTWIIWICRSRWLGEAVARDGMMTATGGLSSCAALAQSARTRSSAPSAVTGALAWAWASDVASGMPGLRRENMVWSGTPTSLPSRAMLEHSRPTVDRHGQPNAKRSRCPIPASTPR